MSVCALHMCVCLVSKEASDPLVSEFPCRCWDSNLSPVEDQPVFFTADPSLQAHDDDHLGCQRNCIWNPLKPNLFGRGVFLSWALEVGKPTPRLANTFWWQPTLKDMGGGRLCFPPLALILTGKFMAPVSAAGFQGSLQPSSSPRILPDSSTRLGQWRHPVSWIELDPRPFR